MKKIFALLALLVLTFGIAQAQDVYFAGNNEGTGKIWKNNTLIYSLTDSLPVNLATMQVEPNGTIYTAGHVYDTTFTQGKIWVNDSCLFVADSGSVINKLLLNGSDWTAAGLSNNQATVWQNGNMLYAQNDTLGSVAYGLAMNGDDIYYAGSETYDDTLNYGFATAWQNDTILWQDEYCSEILDLYHDGNDLYAAGYYYLEGLVFAALWQNDSIVFNINDLDLSSMFTALDIYDDDIYLAGFVEDSLCIWLNGEVLYYHIFTDNYSTINALTVNEYGVYYAGQIDGVATIWKDGEILYQPEDCDVINGLAILPSPEPPAAVRMLPWFDGFETDSTDWEDWTILDYDGNTEIGWQRTDDDAATGDYSARHLACDNIQEGWLITPPLYLQTYCDSTWMSFTTKEVNPDSFTNSGLWISTTDNDIASFSEIWSQEEPSDSWDTIRIDLSEYQGDTVFLAFKYSGHHGHDWYIDNVDVQEALTLYDITVEADSTGWGSTTGSGSYPYGDTIQIEAIPDTGREFICWNDGNLSNPRDIVVTQDSTFVAHFGTLQFTITVESDFPAWGSVTGGGTFYYGDTIEIAATPNLGFAFAGWTDGVMNNPRTVVVTEDHTYIAHFEIRQCLITTEVTPEESGTVNGGGTYDYGEIITLTAHSNTGYVFEKWDDDNLTNPRRILVEGDATYTAVFTPLPYEITTACDPVNGGTVTGAGTYDYGTTVTLTATPNDNFIFLCWSDGIASNPRNIVVHGNATYTALFMQNGTPTYTITVLTNNPLLGNVSGGGEYPEGTTIEITATPSNNAVFSGWDDGNSDNPRSITVTEDMTFTAIFTTIPNYTITVRSDNVLLGTTYGSGTYPANSTVTIGAEPAMNCYFAGWQDGDMNNPRTIVVTGNAEYVASFSQTPVETYTVTVYYDESQGFVIGAGTYTAGSTASLAAIPADGYMFVKWSDESTDNPKEVVVDHDIVLAAFFNGTAIDENDWTNIQLYPNPADDQITIEGLEGKHDIVIYNALGMAVKTGSIQDKTDLYIGDLSAGLYLIRIDGQHAVRIVKK